MEGYLETKNLGSKKGKTFLSYCIALTRKKPIDFYNTRET